MLDNAGDIVTRVGALLDDPANTRYTSAYLMPHIDQKYAGMDVDLERLGMQYLEKIAIVNIDSGVNDLAYLLQDGQPLASMKLPNRIRWKEQGQPDTSYTESDYTDTLDEVGPASIGALEWTYRQGAVQLTPSATALTLKIYFDSVSTTVYDPAQNVIRGTAHILALRVATYVAGLQNGMGSLQKQLAADANKEWTSFCKLATMKNQVKQRVPAPLHPRRSPMGMPVPRA